MRRSHRALRGERGVRRALPEAKDCWLGPPVVPLLPFLGEGFPTKKDHRTKGTRILASLLEDLVGVILDLSRTCPREVFRPGCLSSLKAS